MLWLLSFIETGEMADERDAETFFIRYSLMAIPFTLAGIFLSGLLSDHVQPYKVFIPGFFCHALACYSL